VGERERDTPCAICGFHDVAGEGYSILGQDFRLNWWYVPGIFEKFPIVLLGEFPEKIYKSYHEYGGWKLLRNISNALPVIIASYPI